MNRKLQALLAACGTPAPHTEHPDRTVGFVFIADKRDLGYTQAIWGASETLARA